MGKWGFDISETVDAEIAIDAVNSRYKNQYNNTYCLADFTQKNVEDEFIDLYSGGLFDVDVVDLSVVDQSRAPVIFRTKTLTSETEDYTFYLNFNYVNSIRNSDGAQNSCAIPAGLTVFDSGRRDVNAASYAYYANHLWIIAYNVSNNYFLLKFDIEANDFVDQIAIGQYSRCVWDYDGFLWVAGGFYSNNNINKINPSTASIVDTITGIPGGFDYLQIGEDVWYIRLAFATSNLEAAKIDMGIGSVTEVIDLGRGGNGSYVGKAIYDDTHLWVVNGGITSGATVSWSAAAGLYKIALSTATLVDSISLNADWDTHIIDDGTSIWLTNIDDGNEIHKVVKSTLVDDYSYLWDKVVYDADFANGYLWITDEDASHGFVTKINVTNNTYAQYDFGNNTSAKYIKLAADGAYVSVNSVASNTDVYKMDLTDVSVVDSVSFSEPTNYGNAGLFTGLGPSDIGETYSAVAATIDYTSEEDSSLFAISIPDELIKKYFRFSVGIGEWFNDISDTDNGDSSLSIFFVDDVGNGYVFDLSLEISTGATPVAIVHNSIYKITNQVKSQLSTSETEVSDLYTLGIVDRKYISFEYNGNNLVGYLDGIEVNRIADSTYTDFTTIAVELVSSVDDQWIPSVNWIALTDSSSPSIDLENKVTTAGSYKLSLDQFEANPFSRQPEVVLFGTDFSLVVDDDLSSGTVGIQNTQPVDLSTIEGLGYDPITVVDDVTDSLSSRCSILFSSGLSFYGVNPNGMTRSLEEIPSGNFFAECHVANVSSGWNLTLSYSEATGNAGIAAIIDSSTIDISRISLAGQANFVSESNTTGFAGDGIIKFSISDGICKTFIDNVEVASVDYTEFLSEAVGAFVFENMEISKIEYKGQIDSIEDSYLSSSIDLISDSSLVMEMNYDLNSELDSLVPSDENAADIVESVRLDLINLHNINNKVSNFFRLTDVTSDWIIWNADTFKTNSDTYTLDFLKNFDGGNFSGLYNTNGQVVSGKCIASTSPANVYVSNSFSNANETFTVSFGGFGNDATPSVLSIDDNSSIDPQVSLYIGNTNITNDGCYMDVTQLHNLGLLGKRYVRFEVGELINGTKVLSSTCEVEYDLLDQDLFSIRLFTVGSTKHAIFYFNRIPITSIIIANNSLTDFGFVLNNTTSTDWVPSVNWMSISSGTFYDLDPFGYSSYGFLYRLTQNAYEYVYTNTANQIFGPNIMLDQQGGATPGEYDVQYGDPTSDSRNFTSDSRIINFISNFISDHNYDGICVSGEYTDSEWSSIVTYLKNTYSIEYLRPIMKNFVGISSSPTKTNSVLGDEDIAFWPANAYFSLEQSQVPDILGGDWMFAGTITTQTLITNFKFLVQNVSNPLLGSKPYITITDSSDNSQIYAGYLPISGNYFSLPSIGVMYTEKFYNFSIVGTAGTPGNGFLSCVISGDNLDPISASGTILVLRN